MAGTGLCSIVRGAASRGDLGARPRPVGAPARACMLCICIPVNNGAARRPAGRDNGTSDQRPVQANRCVTRPSTPHTSIPCCLRGRVCRFVENCMGYPCLGIITTVTKFMTADPVSRRRLKSACCSHPSVRDMICAPGPCRERQETGGSSLSWHVQLTIA